MSKKVERERKRERERERENSIQVLSPPYKEIEISQMEASQGENNLSI